jgi:hypothetical protein
MYFICPIFIYAIPYQSQGGIFGEVNLFHTAICSNALGRLKKGRRALRSTGDVERVGRSIYDDFCDIPREIAVARGKREG